MANVYLDIKIYRKIVKNIEIQAWNYEMHPVYITERHQLKHVKGTNSKNEIWFLQGQNAWRCQCIWGIWKKETRGREKINCISLQALQFQVECLGRRFSKSACSWKDTCREEWLMLLCNKCYNEHHDQCMGKAGMYDCSCKCFKKII